VPPTLRPATADDAEALIAVMAEGVAGYRDFAPDWEMRMPPLEGMRARIELAGGFTLLAEADGAVLGHVSYLPSEDSGHPDPQPGLAHLWQMFVRESHQGSGLATELMARAVAAAREGGYTQMRLYTPALQQRARRFYEREGWELLREFFDDRLGLDVAEYRLAL
jgi:GNAT superfamily N-acetyltransferase